MTDARGLYARRVADGRLADDPAQGEAAHRLSDLARRLGESRGGLFGKGRRERVRGLYIWGAVGRGKSMLMDLFFESAPVKDKRRVHFHDFMQETHAFIHAWRSMGPAERKRHPAHVREAAEDPIAPAAKATADRMSLLCFDEFHVTSIADAMILGRLFDQLFDRGVTVVATSNRAPDELYRDGINRQLFLPFIARLKRELDVFELKSARDFRLERLVSAPVYYAPLGAQADASMADAYARLTGGIEPEEETLEVQGRKLRITRASGGVARLGFEELCARPLGAADYLALARRFHTLLLDGVPMLGPERRNEAARFVTLVDVLYERRTKLVMSAAAEPDRLYPNGDGAFEFERTASRLFEMRSAEYLAAERKDVDAAA
jgi:cell division protein ZapE